MKSIAWFVACVLFIPALAFPQQKDNPDCKDYPLFNKMEGTWLRDCDQKEFYAYKFMIAQDKKVDVEGRYRMIHYYPITNYKPTPSDIQILRNFENAVVKIGGKVVYRQKGKETLTFTRDSKEVWVEVWAEFTGKYGLTIVEKSAMVQQIVADASAFMNDIKATGHTSVYGIYFDTGKFDLKPESNQAMEEIAKLLKSDAALKVYIAGHTDNTGTLESNMTLSQQRAEAVVRALINNHGIAATRLRAFGNGPYAPVSTNDTEEGRAKNRRVEIVKQ